MGFNQRRIARERAAAERAERERRQRELGRDVVQAEKLVAILEQPGCAEGAALVLSDDRNGAVGRDALAGAPMPCLPAYRRY
jgi:hypothetical protein